MFIFEVRLTALLFQNFGDRRRTIVLGVYLYILEQFLLVATKLLQQLRRIILSLTYLLINYRVTLLTLLTQARPPPRLLHFVFVVYAYSAPIKCLEHLFQLEVCM